MQHALRRIVRAIPLTLIAIRFLLGPLLLWVVITGIRKNGSPFFLAGFSIAFLSDVFDGIIARRLHIDTKILREYDGWVDIWFYSWICICAWVWYAPIILAFRLPLLIVVSTQCLAWVLDLVKYRRVTNYHAYSSKAWGVTLFIAFIALFGFHLAGLFFWLAIVIGCISHLEEMLMTLALPYWRHDVPTIVHALRLRQAILTQESGSLRMLTAPKNDQQRST